MKKWIVGILLAAILAVAAPTAYMGYYYHQMGIVSQGDSIAPGGTEKAALVVIDIQEGTTGTLASPFSKGLVRQSEPLIRAVNQAIGNAQARQIPVIYILQENIDPIANLLSKNFLAAGSASAAMDARVRADQGPTFVKHKMDAFFNPEFERHLRENGINHLVITGLDASQCVDRTIRGALKRGYRVTAITDAVITNRAEKMEKILRQYQQAGVKLIPLEEWR